MTTLPMTIMRARGMAQKRWNNLPTVAGKLDVFLYITRVCLRNGN